MVWGREKSQIITKLIEMLSYQNENCDLTLREGIDEYRDYLKKNNRHVLGENCSLA